MDEIVMRLVGQGVRSVVNLAAGLDTRAYRLPLPSDLEWIDADLPGMIAYRREHLSDAVSPCRHRDVAVDLQDPAGRSALLSAANPDGTPALVVTEGLLVYLSREDVAALARDVRAVHGVRWWLMDLGSPKLLQMLRRYWHDDLERAGTPMRFAPAEGTAFFEPAGWREAEFRSIWDESLRLKRAMPLAGLFQRLARFRSPARLEADRRISGVVLLEGV